MPIDISADDFLKGASLGLGIADQRLRQQKFRADEADRMIKERLLNQEIEEHAAKLQQVNEEIKQKAAQDAEWKFTLDLVGNDLPALNTAAQGLAGSNPHAMQFLAGQTKAATAEWNRERQPGGTQSYQHLISDIQKYEDLGDTETADALRAKLNKDKVAQSQATTRLEQSEERLGQTKTYQDMAIKLRQAGMDQRNIDLVVKAAREGFVIQPSAEPGTLPGLKPIARPLTTGTTTATQESLRNLANSHAAVQRALQNVESTPEAFGPLGGVRQGLEVARSILMPGQPATITGARATADAAAEDIIRGLKQDSQMSLFEKRQLDRLARITGPANTPDVARAKLGVIEVGLAGKAIRDARLLRLPEPDWAKEVLNTKADLSGYTDSELAQAVKDGYISLERGLKEFRSRKE